MKNIFVSKFTVILLFIITIVGFTYGYPFTTLLLWTGYGCYKATPTILQFLKEV